MCWASSTTNRNATSEDSSWHPNKLLLAAHVVHVAVHVHVAAARHLDGAHNLFCGAEEEGGRRAGVLGRVLGNASGKT